MGDENTGVEREAKRRKKWKRTTSMGTKEKVKWVVVKKEASLVCEVAEVVVFVVGLELEVCVWKVWTCPIIEW